MEELLKNIGLSLTQFHAAARAKEILCESGFEQLYECDGWNVQKGGKYFVLRNDSSLIAFNVGEEFAFNIAAAHIDACCLRVKGKPEMDKGGVRVLNTEVYGGPILNSFFDRKLVLAG
ncbi:MAG: M18 family aminopeptidase, partial [Firmicutes bacterium]|nr:M18 family aminopeptidase [Bacillota bacterium]